ncbi:hypothetical protein TNCV_2693431 [Trichonephila clavipes]|nr:hypothetical protein TNCV_2693431 [Trichonephila clavipes]
MRFNKDCKRKPWRLQMRPSQYQHGGTITREERSNLECEKTLKTIVKSKSFKLYYVTVPTLERLAGILKFQELLKMYSVPVKVVKNENGFHITDCVWSTENCSEGPNTCECYFLFNEPEKYFIVKQLDHVVVRDGSIHHKDCLTKASCQCGRIPSLF